MSLARDFLLLLEGVSHHTRRVSPPRVEVDFSAVAALQSIAPRRLLRTSAALHRPAARYYYALATAALFNTATATTTTTITINTTITVVFVTIFGGLQGRFDHFFVNSHRESFLLGRQCAPLLSVTTIIMIAFAAHAAAAAAVVAEELVDYLGVRMEEMAVRQDHQGFHKGGDDARRAA